MRIANTVSDSIVDGPGLRFTVFTQGCPHRCPGCHNPDTHDPAGGREASVEALAAGGGVHHPLAVFPGVPHPALQKRPVDHRAGVPGENPHREGGGPVEEAHPQGVAVVVLDADDVPVGGPVRDFSQLIVIDPGAAGLEGPALSPLQADNGVFHGNNLPFISRAGACPRRRLSKNPP